MAQKRREKSLYTSLPPITPDLSKLPQIQIKPDTEVERKLYKMLLDKMQQIAVLKAQVRQLRRAAAEYRAKRNVGKVSRGLKPSHLDRAAQKGKDL